MAMITTPAKALARTEWMLAAGYVSQNPCKLAAVRLLRNYRYDGTPGGLLVPLAAAGYIAVDAEDGMWELDLTRLTHAAVDPRMAGVTPAGRKVIGFAAAFASAPSTLGLDGEGADAIAAVRAEAWPDIGAIVDPKQLIDEQGLTDRAEEVRAQPRR